MSVAPVLIVGSVTVLYTRVAAASRALKASESRRASGPAGLVFCAAKRTSTPGSFTTRLTCSRKSVGFSSGSIRTSSVAFASEGITFDR